MSLIFHDQKISKKSKTPKVPANPAANPPISPAPATETAGAAFQRNNTKLYVKVVTLSVKHNINFLENTKQGFKRTIS